jgi:hypothetical protein
VWRIADFRHKSAIRHTQDDVRRIVEHHCGGICVREGRPLRYVEFARYGIPAMLVQLIVSAIYLKFRFLR